VVAAVGPHPNPSPCAQGEGLVVAGDGAGKAMVNIQNPFVVGVVWSAFRDGAAG
jgi:hypothetical protein